MPNRPQEIHSIRNLNNKSPKFNYNLETQHGTDFYSLPSESILHITSFLDPSSLIALSRTAKQLHEYIEDDNTWHRAFVQQFLGIGPENQLHKVDSLMLRRSHNTWRKEFTTRYNLRNRWENSRSTTITHIPHHSAISSMHLMSENALLTSSIQYGIVSRSLPLTGKILRGYLDASGTGLGIGNPNAEFTPNVSACTISSTGGTAKILWGFQNGEVAMMTANKAMDTNRAAAKLVRCNVNDEHSGAVQNIQWDRATEVFASGGSDGKVKLWDAKTVKCLWTSSAKTQLLVNDHCLKVRVLMRAGALVGAFKSGDLILWRGFQSLALNPTLADLPFFPLEIRIPAPIHFVTKTAQHTANVDPELLDFHLSSYSPEQLSILVCYKHHPYFYRINVHPSNGPMTRSTFGDASGMITSLLPVFSSQAGESGFVIVGDHAGCVSVYDWDNSSAEPYDSISGSPTSPLYTFEAHEDSAVTSLSWNSSTLVTGSSRGTVKVFDSLTFSLLRSFSSPAGRPAAGGEWNPVSQIILQKDLLFISVGSRVMTWRASAVTSARALEKTRVSKKVKRSGAHKWYQQVELHKDIIESCRDLEFEQRSTRRTYGREREQLSTLEDMGLDEVEAVEYVLMLSRDEEERRLAESLAEPSPPSPDDGVFEGDFDDIPNAGIYPSGEPSARGTPSSSDRRSSGPSNPPSRHSPPRTAPSITPKVQVSPRLRPEPMEAGPFVSSLPSSIPLHTATIPSADDFPYISPSTSSSTPISSWDRHAPASSTPESLHSAWSNPRRSVMSSQVPSPGSSPVGGGVVSRSSSGQGHARPADSGPSLLSAQLAMHVDEAGVTRRSVETLDEEMDEDLRFAIELSLAEARSRGEE